MAKILKAVFYKGQNTHGIESTNALSLDNNAVILPSKRDPEHGKPFPIAREPVNGNHRYCKTLDEAVIFLKKKHVSAIKELQNGIAANERAIQALDNRLDGAEK